MSPEQTASLANGPIGGSPQDRPARRRRRQPVTAAEVGDADDAGETPAPIPAHESARSSAQSSATSDQGICSEPLPHRPPVAVVATPVAFRSDSENQAASIVRPAAQTHEIADRSPRTASLSAGPEVVSPKATHQRSIEGIPEDIDLTPLSIEPAQVRSLTILGDLKRFAVADNEVCQIFRSGQSQLKVIGVEVGVTRLAVWAVTEPGEPPRLRVFEIRVAEALGRGGPLADDPTERLNDSLRRVFPAADVRVHRRGDTLVVSGRCGGNEAATEIIRLVRKSCLIPVKDELVIR
jgi:Flp pilus assembly secretin CpaC